MSDLPDEEAELRRTDEEFDKIHGLNSEAETMLLHYAEDGDNCRGGVSDRVLSPTEQISQQAHRRYSKRKCWPPKPQARGTRSENCDPGEQSWAEIGFAGRPRTNRGAAVRQEELHKDGRRPRKKWRDCVERPDQCFREAWLGLCCCVPARRRRKSERSTALSSGTLTKTLDRG